ncbi:16S rRNA (cytidine(1402)-2'-O)-methyltransferase [Kiloniella laminariae]|uniref:Ribosomal RNA small subunit methyltransferase I n=1 Tax=Kiloniella laminariae TaxID=454162 RepID=A0ABT4LJD8_9PROT|nr:16S rRNA (cytidine(1402)-2'-O)-methyltransferase [Kiloniella laminariae]MCZ4281228.1 16S rRNA (cytidine(1402)-2'-O)-methyltransferase [Kiloniella laminariae]
MSSKPSSSRNRPASHASRANKALPEDQANRISAPEAEKPAEILDAALYLVATPIGNLGDMSDRAKKILAAADLIACEDTRVTKKLAQAFGFTAPLIAYHEHNAEKVRPKLIEKVKNGNVVALVSDAGTPLISDPGYKLAASAIDEGIGLISIPGASAPLTALLLSGLPSDRFFFNGFLPSKTGARCKSLKELETIPSTLIFFESANRLAKSLIDMAAVLGNRPAAVARELTKKFEEVRRGSLQDLAAHYTEAGGPKGEIVVVVGPPGKAAAMITDASLDEQIRDALGQNSLRDAAEIVATATGLPKKKVYQRALGLATKTDD